MDERGTKKKMLLELTKRPIAYHRVFSDVCGSVTAGLMLSQAFYWYDKTDPSGWFWKTRDQWAEETGMSRTEQENARKALKKLGFLEEKREGLPAKMFYRLDLDRLIEAIEKLDRPQPSSMQDSALLLAGNLPTGRQETSQLYKEQESTSETTSNTPSDSIPSSAESSKKTPDPRHSLFVKKHSELYCLKNHCAPAEVPWGPRDAKLLSKVLKEHPGWSSSFLERILTHKFQSKKGLADPPTLWMGSMIRYLTGPLDEYGTVLARQAEAPMATDALADAIRQRGGPDALKRRHAERNG